jgi:hypothetical protein
MPNNKLKVSEVIECYSALAALDACKRTIGEGKDSKEVSILLDDKVSWNLAKDRRLLKAEVEVYEELRVKILNELSPLLQDISKEDVATRSNWNVRIQVIMKNEVEIPGLLLITEDDLTHKGDNPIPITIREALLPLLK